MASMWFLFVHLTRLYEQDRRSAGAASLKRRCYTHDHMPLLPGSQAVSSCRIFCSVSLDLDVADGHFDSDVLEVLKVKTSFYNADKSIFEQTRENCSNCQKRFIYLELNDIFFLMFAH